jgi:DNA-binding MarR family transcriptional regulator
MDSSTRPAGEPAGPVPDSAVRAASDLRSVVSRMRRRMRELAEADDLTPSQTAVLSRLDKDGPASASELAAAERVRPQSMAATVAALDQRGMIRRSPSPHDGRKQIVSLSEQGRDRLAGDRRTRQEWLARALDQHCTEAERRTVIEAMAVLDRVIEA